MACSGTAARRPASRRQCRVMSPQANQLMLLAIGPVTQPLQCKGSKEARSARDHEELKTARGAGFGPTELNKDRQMEEGIPPQPMCGVLAAVSAFRDLRCQKRHAPSGGLGRPTNVGAANGLDRKLRPPCGM